MNSIFKNPYYTALARERYVQNKDVMYINGELRDDLDINLITYKLNGGTQDWNFPLIVEKPIDEEFAIEGKTTKHNTNGFVYWYGKMDNGTIGEYRDINGTYNDSPEELARYGNYTDRIKYKHQENQGLTLTAAYKVQLEYDANGGINAPVGTYYGIHYADDNMQVETTPVPTKEDSDYVYEFTGWSKSINPEATEHLYSPGERITIDVNTTLYAQWKAKQYYIIYDFNINSGDKLYNGTVSNENETTSPKKFLYDIGVHPEVYSNRTIRVAPDGQKWILDGWVDAAGNEYPLNSTYAGDKTITLKAKWKEKNIKLNNTDTININIYWTRGYDIDSHCYGYDDSNNQYFHVYYNNRKYYYNGNRAVWLDFDDTGGGTGENTKIYLENLSKNENINLLQFDAHIFSGISHLLNKVPGLKIIITNESNSQVLFEYSFEGNSTANVRTKTMATMTKDGDFWVFEADD